MQIGQTTFIYFISKIVGSILGFFATIYFARVLGEVVLGQYALVLALIAWLGVVGKVGFSSAITKRISENKEPTQFLGAGVVVMFSLMVIVGFFVVIFRAPINAYIGVPVAEFVLLLLFLKLYKNLVNASLKGNHLVHAYAVLSSGNQIITAVAQISLVAIGLSLTGMLWGYAIALVVTATIGLLFLGLRPSLPEKHHIISLFNYAKFSWLGSMRSRTFDTVDIAVLGLFVSQGLVGIYSVAWSLSKFLDIFGSAISSTLFPEMSKVSAKNDLNAISGLVTDGLAYAGLILIPGLVGAAVLSDRLMNIYGESFVAGAEILTILIVSLLVYTYNKQLLNTLNAVDRPDLAFRANAIFILTNIALNIILIWQIGWIGAAIATALSAGIGLIFAFYYTRRLITFELPTSEISRQWIAALFMGLVVYATRQIGETNWEWINDYNAIFVVVLVSLGAAIYFLSLLAISAQFRKTVDRNLPINIPLLSR